MYVHMRICVIVYCVQTYKHMMGYVYINMRVHVHTYEDTLMRVHVHKYEDTCTHMFIVQEFVCVYTSCTIDVICIL